MCKYIQCNYCDTITHGCAENYYNAKTISVLNTGSETSEGDDLIDWLKAVYGVSKSQFNGERGGLGPYKLVLGCQSLKFAFEFLCCLPTLKCVMIG